MQIHVKQYFLLKRWVEVSWNGTTQVPALQNNITKLTHMALIINGYAWDTLGRENKLYVQSVNLFEPARARRVCVIQPACSVFIGMSHPISRLRRRGQWVLLRGCMWGRMEEGIAGHHSNLRCLSDSENISKYLHLHYCLFLSTTRTHTHSLYLHICYFFPCIVGRHTCLARLKEGQ